MAQYLKITSRSVTNVVDMFTLGVSTSSGTDKIGQFGSGALMSTLLWLREFGDSPIYNVNGTKVTFESEPERKSDGSAFHRVFQKNGKCKRIPLSVSLEYGQHDWKDPVMALREWISNALDQGSDLTQCIEVVSKIDLIPDEVSVFVPMSSIVRKYWQEIDKYFLHFTNRQESKYILKNEISKCRIYRRGVFIREMDSMSVFDYNLDFAIDESRNGSADSINSMIMDCVIGYPRMDQHYYDDLLRHVRTNSDCIEVREQTWRTSCMEVWRPTIEKLVGVIKIGMFSERNEEEHIEALPIHWYQRFIKLVPEIDGYADRSKSYTEGHEIIAPTEEAKATFHNLVQTFEFLGLTNGKDAPKFEVFRTKDGQRPSRLANYGNGIVSVYKDNETSRRSMIEELAHHYSGKSDCTREFQEYNFQLMTKMSEHFHH